MGRCVGPRYLPPIFAAPATCHLPTATLLASPPKPQPSTNNFSTCIQVNRQYYDVPPLFSTTLPVRCWDGVFPSSKPKWSVTALQQTSHNLDHIHIHIYASLQQGYRRRPTCDHVSNHGRLCPCWHSLAWHRHAAAELREAHLPLAKFIARPVDESSFWADQETAVLLPHSSAIFNLSSQGLFVVKSEVGTRALSGCLKGPQTIHNPPSTVHTVHNPPSLLHSSPPFQRPPQSHSRLSFIDQSHWPLPSARRHELLKPIRTSFSVCNLFFHSCNHRPTQASNPPPKAISILSRQGFRTAAFKNAATTDIHVQLMCAALPSHWKQGIVS